MSRGLQILQSKISVLEDLSDRTETQVIQLTALLEQKCRDIQNLMVQSEKQIQKIESSMTKSLDVAKIFQDKIPHQEIIERQNTVKYVKAARMAHQGHSIDEIAAQVDLSRGEIEFISKVNRDQLQFSEEDLPEWTKSETTDAHRSFANETIRPPIARAPEKALSDLGSQFRSAMASTPIIESTVFPTTPLVVQEETVIKPVAAAPTGVRDNVVKKVIFPKLEVNNNLG
jgi:mannose/fructose/N-acetylgalactosamine-specific phosphotransferase system component IIB